MPIIVRMDGGFFDGELFWKLDINPRHKGFVCSGRMSDIAKETFNTFDSKHLETHETARQSWRVADFGYRCKALKAFYRGVYMQQFVEVGQHVLDFAVRDQFLISNLGTGKVFKRIGQAQRAVLETTDFIIGNTL